MSKPCDLFGKKFGELTAIEPIKGEDGRRRRWLCKCSCGNTAKPLAVNLKRGMTKSCGCKRSTDLTGKKVGKLTVIEKTDDRSGSCIKWLCKCECGKTSKVSSTALAKNKTLSCGCTTKPDLTGKTYGDLVVLGKDEKQDKRFTWWSCECKCGNKIRVTSGQLNYGSNTSCGVACPIKTNIAPIKVFYSTYKRSAREYDRDFSITLYEFIEIVSNPCFYCGHEGTDKGIPLKKARKAQRQRRGKESGVIDLESFYYIANGIDRIDSSKGYTKDNCLPCCRPCNVSKSDSDVSSFMDRICKIFERKDIIINFIKKIEDTKK